MAPKDGGKGGRPLKIQASPLGYGVGEVVFTARHYLDYFTSQKTNYYEYNPRRDQDTIVQLQLAPDSV